MLAVRITTKKATQSPVQLGHSKIPQSEFNLNHRLKSRWSLEWASILSLGFQPGP